MVIAYLYEPENEEDKEEVLNYFLEASVKVYGNSEHFKTLAIYKGDVFTLPGGAKTVMRANEQTNNIICNIEQFKKKATLLTLGILKDDSL